MSIALTGGLSIEITSATINIVGIVNIEGMVNIVGGLTVDGMIPMLLPV